jgi:DNA-binding transcriptional LysR family regulator
LTVAVNGPLVVDDVDLVIRAALDGVGLAYLGEDRAAPHLDSGALVRVLEPWCQPFSARHAPSVNVWSNSTNQRFGEAG